MNAQVMFVILCSLFIVIQSDNYDYQGPFSHIYKDKIWNVNGPLSGPGSNPCHFLKYLIALQKVIDRGDISSIAEIGFGDFEMMQHIIL